MGLNPLEFSLSEDERLSQLGPSHASSPRIIVVSRFRRATDLLREDVNMSESSSEANPQILVNVEQQEQRRDDAAGGPDEEGCSEMQAKMQSAFQQVRNQIRSQVGMRAPKGSILELMQRVKDREIRIVNGEPEGKDVSSEEKKQDVLEDDSKDEMALTQEELCAVFEKKVAASEKALRDEFEAQVSQVRAEMQAYTDQALQDLQCKIQPKEQQESRGPDRKPKPAAPPPLASRRGRLLTRTMTTIIPKSCAPVIVGPRAKSETLSSSKGESSRLLPRDPVVLSLPGNRPCQSRKPLLPPAHPTMHQRKKPVRPKAKTGN